MGYLCSPAAVVATPSTVVTPAPALSYSSSLPTVSAAPVPVTVAAPVATLAPRATSVPAPAVSYSLPQTGIVTATPAPVVAAPAPVVEYIQPAPTFQTAPATMTVTGVDMNRDGIPDVLQQPQVGYGVPLQYGAPGNFVSTMTVTGVDMNRDGIPDVCNNLKLVMVFPCSMERLGISGRR